MSDILATATLTAGAAIVVASYALLFATTVTERWIIAAAMLTWFIVVCWMGESQVLLSSQTVTLPGLATVVAVPLTTLSLLLLGTTDGRRRVRAAPLPALIGVQVIRNLGVWFVLLHASGRLPAPFAPVAGWGDMLAGTLAIPAAWLAWRKPHGARAGMIVWSVIGAADLVAAVSLGLTSLPGPLRLFTDPPGSALMNTLPWIFIPGFLVPSLLTLHVVVFYRLLAPSPGQDGRYDPAVSISANHGAS